VLGVGITGYICLLQGDDRDVYDVSDLGSCTAVTVALFTGFCE